MIGEEISTHVWDAKLLPVIKCMTASKKNLTMKQAAEVDKMKVDYFRGKDFVQFMITKDAVLKKHCKAALDEYLDGRTPADVEDASIIGTALLENGFIVRAQYRPLVEGQDDVSAKKKKWPDRLVRRDTKVFDPESFYIMQYEGSQTFRHLCLAGLILAILGVCMWPVWPPWARIAAWYLILGLSTFYILLELTRMSCFVTGWLVGVEFWIFPNFNDEYVGIVDSFKPIYSFERRRDGVMMLVTRLIIFIIMAMAVEELSKTHSISDVQDFIVGSYQDIITWGENKALMLDAAPEKMALPNLADLEAEVEADRMAEAAGGGGGHFEEAKEEM